MTREELLSSKEYWIGEIQFNLFKIIKEYMEVNKLNRKELAEKLGVTKGYVSRILNGEYDHRISKIIELSLAIGKVPTIKYDDLEDILFLDKNNISFKSKNGIPEDNLQIQIYG